MKINRKILNFSIMTAASIFLAASLCGCSGKADNNAATGNAGSGKALPMLQSTGRPLGGKVLKGLNGDNITFKGKDAKPMTIVSLWSPTWFDGSDAQLMQLMDVNNKYGSQGLRIVLMAYEVPAEKAQKEVRVKKIPFEVGIGSPELYETLGVKSIPTTWYLDSDGNLLDRAEGFQTADEISQTIDRLCQENDPNATQAIPEEAADESASAAEVR